MARGTVLIVEDEPLLRIDAATIAEDAGYAVVEAADAAEATNILACRDDISCIYTDIEMPGAIDGLQLAAFVHDRWPAMGVIVTSGRIKATAADLPEHAVFLPKPVRGQDLNDTLGKVCC